jgi:hypothetical protein
MGSPAQGGIPLRRGLAAVGFTLAVGLGAASLWLGPAMSDQSPEGILWIVAGLLFSGVGALIIARASGNAVGVLSLVGGLLWLLNMANAGAADLVASIDGGPPAWARWSAWVASWNYLPMMAVLGFLLPSVFPTGRFPSGRFRVAAVLVLSVTGIACLLTMVRPGVIPSTDDAYVNPLGIEAFTWAPSPDTFAGIIPILFLTAVVGVALRFRRSSGVERAQLKWFLAAASAVAASIPVMLTLEALDLSPPARDGLMVASFLLVPVAIGIAVMRHGLYEIDRLISRTVSYALVTGVLLGVYAAAVVALGQVLSPITLESEVTVAASTLIVAALFQPVRRRVQAFVDRRFNRSRYDAQRTVADFATRLRDAVDLDDLNADLLTAIDSTVAPAQVGLWLREARYRPAP